MLAALALALTTFGCFSDGPRSTQPALGGTANATPSEGGQGADGQGAGGDAATELPAGLRFYHALPTGPRVTLSVDDEPLQELELGSASEQHYVSAGGHLLRAWAGEILLAEA
jgi:hypothetical protein